MKNSYVGGEIVSRAMAAFNCNTLKQLADILGISAEDLSNRKRRGTLSKIIEIEAYKRSVNVNWLKTGQGEMQQRQTSSISGTQTEYIKKYDLLRKTEKILESDTVYKTALCSNIEAFHTAITCHEELAVTNKRIDKIEAENKRLIEEITKLNNRLPAVGES